MQFPARNRVSREDSALVAAAGRGRQWIRRVGTVALLTGLVIPQGRSGAAWAQGIRPGHAGAEFTGRQPAGPVLRHEPIFGVGPHTMYRGGFGIELELESEGGELTVPVELLYGVTEVLSVTGVLPFRNPTENGSLGDIGVRGKWRFATRFAPGRMDALAIVGGVTFPRSVDGAPRGGPVIMAGLAAGREDRRWYYFAGARGFLRTDNDGFDPGERLALNLAWGVRPWRTGYLEPDLVLLLEANGRAEERSRRAGAVLPQSGGRVLSISPAFLLSYRNLMLKGGVDVPVWEDFNDPARDADVKLLAAIEVHY